MPPFCPKITLVVVLAVVIMVTTMGNKGNTTTDMDTTTARTWTTCLSAPCRWTRRTRRRCLPSLSRTTRSSSTCASARATCAATCSRSGKTCTNAAHRHHSLPCESNTFNSSRFTDHTVDLVAQLHVKSSVYDFCVDTLYDYFITLSRTATATAKTAAGTTSSSAETSNTGAAFFPTMLATLTQLADCGDDADACLSLYPHPPRFSRNYALCRTVRVQVQSGFAPAEAWQYVVRNFDRDDFFPNEEHLALPAHDLVAFQVSPATLLRNAQASTSSRSSVNSGHRYLILVASHAPDSLWAWIRRLNNGGSAGGTSSSAVPSNASNASNTNTEDTQTLELTVFVLRVSKDALFPREGCTPAEQRAELAYLRGMVAWVAGALGSFTGACGQYLVNARLLHTLSQSDSAYCHSISPGDFLELVSSCTKVPLVGYDPAHLAELADAAAPRSTLACGALPWSAVIQALVQESFPTLSRAMVFENNVVNVAIFHPRDENTFILLVWSERTKDVSVDLCKRGRYLCSEQHSQSQHGVQQQAQQQQQSTVVPPPPISESDAEFVTQFVRAVLSRLLTMLPECFGFVL